MSSESGGKEEIDEKTEFEQYVSVEELVGVSAVDGRARWPSRMVATWRPWDAVCRYMVEFFGLVRFEDGVGPLKYAFLKWSRARPTPSLSHVTRQTSCNCRHQTGPCVRASRARLRCCYRCQPRQCGGGRSSRPASFALTITHLPAANAMIRVIISCFGASQPPRKARSHWWIIVHVVT